MTIRKTILFTKIAGLTVTLILSQLAGYGRMPAESHDAIRGLFDSHDKFQREVKETVDGYVSTTTSNDPEAVKLLQIHVRQMESRLIQGLMVRHWDPAYPEFVSHFDDIDIKIVNIPNGISVTAVGATEEAIKVARNHAGIISKYVKNGWKEHDKKHPAVYASAGSDDAFHGSSCCSGPSESGEGQSCCSHGSDEESESCSTSSCREESAETSVL